MVFRGVDWHTYHTLSEATAEGQHFHLVYDGKDMEIVVTSNVHEHWKALLSKLISAVTSWLSIDCVSCGETTWMHHVMADILRMRQTQLVVSRLIFPITLILRRSVRPGRRSTASRWTRPTIPFPTWRLRSTCPRPRLIVRPFMRKWESPRFGGTSGARSSSSSSASRMDLTTPVEASRFLPIRAEEFLTWLTAEDASHEPAWNRRLNQWAMQLGQKP